MIERECAHRGVKLNDLTKPEYYEQMLRRNGFNDFEDICCSVGYGGMAATYVVSRLIEEAKNHGQATAAALPPEIPTEVNEKLLSQRRANHGIVMTGNEDLDIPVRFARCCSPVPGDEIVGYITRGRGVTIHKAECVNVQNGETERRIPVEWANDGESSFYASIKVVAYDRVNLLGEIASIIGEMNVPIKAAQAQTDDRTKISTLKLTLDVHSRAEMDKVIQLLQKQAHQSSSSVPVKGLMTLSCLTLKGSFPDCLGWVTSNLL